MAVFNQAATVSLPGLDEIVNNSRMRATATNPLGVNYICGSGAPATAAPGATTTITAAQLLTGIITLSPTAACTATFDTGANIVANVNSISAGAVVGDYICVLIINGNATNAITLAVPASGGFDGNNANRTIPVSSSKYCYIRLTNVTPGSEAYVVYF